MKAKKKNREKSSTYPNLRIDELLTLFDTALKSCPIACHLKLVAGQCPPGSKGILSQTFLAANLNVVTWAVHSFGRNHDDVFGFVTTARPFHKRKFFVDE